MKYYAIKFGDIQVLSGMRNRNAFYSHGIVDVYSPKLNIYSQYDKIFLKLEDYLKGIYSELSTGKKFKMTFDGNDRHFESIDKSCQTVGVLSLNLYFGCEDPQYIVNFIQELRDKGLYELYLNTVREMLQAIEINGKNVLAGYGKASEISDPEDYLEGVRYDSEILKQRKKERK